MNQSNESSDKSKFTPGPWEASNPWLKVFAGNMNVADVRGWGHLTGVGGLNLPEDKAIEIQKANALLIAAAPELYAALKTLHDHTAEYARDNHAMKLDRVALAKADGETK